MKLEKLDFEKVAKKSKGKKKALTYSEGAWRTDDEASYKEE